MKLNNLYRFIVRILPDFIACRFEHCSIRGHRNSSCVHKWYEKMKYTRDNTVKVA